LNFYDFHIGDYASRTAHLEPMEDLAYRRLLDLYYTREVALPADIEQIARLIRMRDHTEVIRAVLREFFTDLDGEGWMHSRCEEVIAAAVAKRESAKKSADARWGKNERNASAMPTHSERTQDAMPPQCEGNAPSPSPSPIKEKARKRATSFDAESIELPPWLSREVWAEWVKERRTRGKAITERGAAAQLKSLDEYRHNGHSPERVIAHAIASGNQGLYPPPVVKGVAQQPEPKPVEVWKPPPPLTAEERAASDKARAVALASLTIINRRTA
jgi:uncharacterized protein YdaU (DUF1376 family)